MRNFFEHQDRARRNTGWLLFLFFFAVVALGIGVYLATLLGLQLSHVEFSGTQVGFQTHRGYTHGDAAREVRPFRLWRPDIFAGCFAGTLLVIFIASLGRTSALRSGGTAVAEMLGGRLVPPGTSDPRERRLRNVVEEMAIASSVPVPQVFVLDEEPGINAFAAGHTPGDAAVVVTRGTLERLNRDELQGVVGHEFSHILNGDMRLNVRLMGVLFGILVIGIIGRGMIRIMPGSRRSVRGGRGGGAALAFIVAGALIALIGYAGLLCARLIKAAVSRQREFLADAASVQFTRNPNGIAGALKKIGGHALGSAVGAPRAEEASHFFFHTALSYNLLGGLFATHPPLAERIRRVDPSFDGNFPEVPIVDVEEALVDAETAAVAGFAASPVASLALDPSAVIQQVGHPRPEHTDYAVALLRELPDALRQATTSSFTSCALIYGLLLSDVPETRDRQAAMIREHSGEDLLRETWRLAAALGDMDARWRLPVAKLAQPVLRQMTADQRARFSKTIGELIAADQQVSLFEFALTRTLLRHLTPDRAAATPRVSIRSLDAVLGEAGLLLSCLAHSGSRDEPENAGRAFAAGVARFGAAAQGLALLPAERCPLSEVEQAVERLRATSPRLRETILDACAHCVLSDYEVTPEEADLLRVVADALDCPLPPFLTPAA